MASAAAVQEPKGPRYPIESVANAARLLSLYTDSRELRLSDVAEALSVSPSTAHRLLTTLEAAEVVKQNPTTRCYEPGPALISIAQALVPPESRWNFVRPYLAELSERVGETVNLMVLQGTQVVFVESVESTRSVRVGSRLGATMPAHCTSGGKLLLSLLPEQDLVELYPHPELERMTDKSIGTRPELVAELRRVARRGYATNFSESETGISGVAVLTQTMLLPSYALAISAPSPRLQPARVKELVHQLRITADALAAHGG